MSRSRVALITGGSMVIVATIIGCCAPVFLQPQPPWEDVVAQQAAWDMVLRRLLAVAGALLLGALPLLAYGFVGLRRDSNVDSNSG